MRHLFRFDYFSEQYARSWPTLRNIGPCKVVSPTPIRRRAITTTTTSTSTSTSTSTTTTTTQTSTTTRTAADRTPHATFVSRTGRLRRTSKLKRTRVTETETHAHHPSPAPPPLKQRHALQPTDANAAPAPAFPTEDKDKDKDKVKVTDKTVSVGDGMQTQTQVPTFSAEDKTIPVVDDGARTQTQGLPSPKAQATTQPFDMDAEEEKMEPKSKSGRSGKEELQDGGQTPRVGPPAVGQEQEMEPKSQSGRSGKEELQDGGQTPRTGPLLVSQEQQSPSRTVTAAQALEQLINAPILSSRSPAPCKRESTRSPMKTLAHLQQLHKPVVYNSDEASVRKRIPDDLRSLWDHLQQLCTGDGYIPARLRGLDCDIDINGEHELCHADDARTDLQLAFEYETLRAAQTNARKYEAEGDGETQWYCAVHWPILDAAFKLSARLDPKAVTHARPISAFLPRIGTQLTKSKLVDFAVNLVLPSLADGGPDLNAWLAAQPASTATVNQSLAGSLTRNPTLLPIEVKTGQGTELEAQMQMGIWVSAWHGRIRALHRADKEKGVEELRRIFTLPVIITSAHIWQLYFAVDQGDKIEMLRFPGEIGGTLSLPKCYRLVECLRRIGRYGVEGFEPWVLETFRFGDGAAVKDDVV